MRVEILAIQRTPTGLGLTAPAALLAAALTAASTLHAAIPQLEFTEISDRSSIVDIRNAGDGSGRLFLVDRGGRIFVYKNGTVLPTPFLDLSSKVSTTGDERGLLSLAFAPDYVESGQFYVWYTDLVGDTLLCRFLVSANPDVADPATELLFLRVEQPAANHNGGQLAFGPDGMLYLSTGDGGGAPSAAQNAQDKDSLLGKILRLDAGTVQDQGYTVPPDNPFVGVTGARPEIWALGLRNPWRISFDRYTGDLFVADVGDVSWEEVNVQPAASAGGENYGWPITEGEACRSQVNCDQAGLTPPAFAYQHAEHCSVTGGEVYRGNAYPNLHGYYLFGDFCSGTIWGLRRQGVGWQADVLTDTGFSISTFGQGEDGSIYVSDYGNGVFLVHDGEVVAEPEFRINAGLNDAWYNPATNGQGFFVTVFPDIQQLFLAWFTYDVERPPGSVSATLGEPGHRWLTAFGAYSGNRALLDIEVTSGGVFNSAAPPASAEVDGTIELEFIGCNAATVRYEIDSLGLEGTVPIQRISLDNVPRCESLSAAAQSAPN